METEPWVQEMQHQNKQMKIQMRYGNEPMDDEEIYEEIRDIVRDAKLDWDYKDQMLGWLKDARSAFRRGGSC